MKHRTLFATTAAMIFAWAPVQAESETAQLRARVAEQERQIRMLEEENTRLRADATSRESRNAQATGMNLVSMPSTPAPATTSRTAESSDAVNEYTVVAGDNLARIGRKFEVSAEAIAKANGIGGDMIIRPGQKLKIPVAQSASASPQQSAAPVAPAETKKLATHTVAAGETFYSISRQHNIAVDRLIAANPDAKPSALRVGQKIQLPQTSSSAQASTTVERAPTSPVAAQEPAPEPVLENRRQVRTMTIDGEMSYGAFAAKHGTTHERLNQLNGLDLDGRTILAKGSELYVPTQP